MATAGVVITGATVRTLTDMRQSRENRNTDPLWTFMATSPGKEDGKECVLS